MYSEHALPLKNLMFLQDLPFSLFSTQSLPHLISFCSFQSLIFLVSIILFN